MRLVIRGGHVIDPSRKVDKICSVIIENGKIFGFDLPETEGERVIDAEGRIVCPGFIDIHAHEDPISEGRILPDESDANLACLLRQGVTTALVGNCGDNAADPLQFLEFADDQGCYTNIAMLAGYTYYREILSTADRYSAASETEWDEIAGALVKALKMGCFGVSLGLEYVPGMSGEELEQAAKVCSYSNKLITAHIRGCAEQAVAAAKEIMDLGAKFRIPVQISHIGSMAAYGQMRELLDTVERYRENGVDVYCDCYPYDAFSTYIGSAPYDDLDSIHCCYSDIEMSEGEFRGQRCTKEIFESERRIHPNYLTVGHVMNEAEIREAYMNSRVLVGSDCFLSDGLGHPRAAGAFPRFLSHYTGEDGLSLSEAIARITQLPAERLGLEKKGTLAKGADADIVIFDPVKLQDCASFAEPTLPPDGIECVLIEGEIAVIKGEIVNGHLGKAVRK